MARDSILAHAYAVILAGGSGTRFWPASRRRRPKQLLPGVFGTRTLLENTIDRIRPLISADHTLVLTNRALKAQTAQLLSGIPRSQIVAEPASRNTAPAIGLAAQEVLRRDPDGIIVVLPSDHLIAKPAAFRRTLNAAIRWAAVGERSVLIGMQPSSAHTGFGYIHRSRLAAHLSGQRIYRVTDFTEKPSANVARNYLASGQYLWNGGMFVWRASTLLVNLERFTPQIARGLKRIAEAGGAQSRKALDSFYPRLPKISIDYAVAEKAKDMYVIAADLGWSDVGSWPEVYSRRPKDRNGNARPPNSFCFGAQGNLILARKFVAAVGVRDLVIVETADAILVASRNQGQQVGTAVTAMRRAGWKELL
jgi:mannose-1-phosphate guanylyltransferase